MKEKFFRSKKGNLLTEETLKIIIAVVCIIFLAALLASIYFSVTDSGKVKEAQAIVSGVHGISEEVRRIETGGSVSSQGFFVPNPSDWYIYGFAVDTKKPNACSGNNCICICPNSFVDIFDAQIKDCDSKGSCTPVPDLNAFDKIKIEKNGVYISIQKVNSNLEVAKK